MSSKVIRAAFQKATGGVEVLQYGEIPAPTFKKPTDILVRVKAVSVNPVDTKQRKGATIAEGNNLVLGFDAAGVVEEVQANSKFSVGDEVWFAGDITRPGTNGELAVVDERIVSKKPSKLSFTEAAGMPLVILTAWEALHEQINIPLKGAKGTILIIGGAGGVGSIGIQLAKLAGLKIIATASREETSEYSKKLGAEIIVNHRNPLQPQLKEKGIEGVDYILNTSDYDNAKFLDWVSLLNPLGKIVTILPPTENINAGALFRKRGSLSFELMFTRPIFDTEPEKQGKLLADAAALFDKGELQHTVTVVKNFWTDLQETHKLLESGNMIGKAVLELNH